MTQYYQQTEAATIGALWKKMFLEISQNSQENTCAGVSLLINLQASGLNENQKQRAYTGFWFSWEVCTYIRYIKTRSTCVIAEFSI